MALNDFMDMYILSPTGDECVTSVVNRQPASTCTYFLLSDSLLAILKGAFSANITAAFQSNTVSCFAWRCELFVQKQSEHVDCYVTISWNCISEILVT